MGALSPLAIFIGKITLLVDRDPPHEQAAIAALKEFCARKPKRLPYDATLHELGLSVHTANLLEKHGIKKVGALQKCTRSELLEIHGFGEVMASEVEERLAAVKRKLRKG